MKQKQLWIIGLVVGVVLIGLATHWLTDGAIFRRGDRTWEEIQNGRAWRVRHGSQLSTL